MEYCNKTREELAEDIARLKKRVEELKSSTAPANMMGLDRHIDPSRLWQDTFNVVDDLMYVVDRGFQIIRANRATSEILKSHDILGKKCFNLFHQLDNPASHCPACKVFHSGEPYHFERQEKIFDNRWFSISAYPVKDEFGFVWQCLVIYRDITDSRKMMDRLSDLEVKDHLTGLINRRHFIEVVGREFRLAARRGGGLVLILLAVEKFKHINESCGRKFGDFLLKEVSDLLVTKVRNTDICSRVGADEFAVLLPDADFREGKRIAENIHKQISDFVFDDGQTNRQVSVSIGLAANNEHLVKDHEEFFSVADKALNDAKSQGGGRVSVPVDCHTENEIEMISNY